MWRKHVAIPQEVEISAMLTLGLAHKPANKLFDKQLIREDRREENEIREALDINAGAYDADRRDDDLDFPVFEILAGLRVIFFLSCNEASTESACFESISNSSGRLDVSRDDKDTGAGGTT